MTCRRALLKLLKVLAVVLCLLAAQEANAQAPARSDIVIRIYDYVSLKPDLLARAQAQIAIVYQQIGVNVAWRTTVHAAPIDPADPLDVDPGELVVKVLNHRLARRLGVPTDVVGAAAMSDEGPGRIAYVLFDRVRHAADLADTSLAEMIALVVAHELGHLLLPVDSHSASGVMRGRWNLQELRLDSGRFEFTPMQAETIRQRVRRAP